MLPPIKVELVPHVPSWAIQAERESQALMTALSSSLDTVHHIGSTAIPGIRAKPIIDLIPVAVCLDELDDARHRIEALGYVWWGELGLPARRYCTKSDPHTGDRWVHLHCYPKGSTEIARHVAFRDYLLAHPDIAQAYEQVKLRCQALHGEDSHAYGACKHAWIKAREAEALAFFKSA